MSSTFKGIPYPARLPTFHRLLAPASVAHLVQWSWIPEWDIEPGRTSRQQLLAFAACNLVVQAGGVELSGPATRASNQDLTGRGWEVDALLKPAAVPHFTANPAELRDARLDLSAPKLRAAVVHAMGGEKAEIRREAAVAIFADWLAEQIPEVSAEALLANAMTDSIAGNHALVHRDEVAAKFGYADQAHLANDFQ